MPSPSDREKSSGTKKFVIVEDLTAPTYKKLQELLGDDRVEKAWSVDGHLRFILTGNDKTVKKVKSVFDSTEQIIDSASF